MPSAASRRLEPRLHAPPPLRPHGRRDPSRPSLAQFVVLSMLLHALFILLFGSPPGGSSEGRAMWGTLDVTIRGPLLDSGIGLRRDRGEALRLPGSEMLEKRERRREAAAPVPPPPPEPRRKAYDPESPRVADIPAPAPIAPIVPATAPAADLAPAPRIDPPQAEARVIPVPAIDWAPVPEAPPSPRIDAPLADAPAIDAPRPVRVPVVPAPMLRESGSTGGTTPLAPPVAIAPPPAPPRPAAIEMPAIDAPPLPQAAAPAAAPALAPPVDVQPVAPPAPPVAAPQPGTPAREAPAESRRPSEREPPAGARAGEPPRRDSPLFDNRKAPAAEGPAPGDAPRIDLEAAKARARQIAREGTGNRALLPFPMPPAPERKTREQIAIEKAWKPDCKDAYKGMGLLAVVPLIANEFGEGNCRW